MAIAISNATILIIVLLFILIFLGVNLVTGFGIAAILLFLQSPGQLAMTSVGQTTISAANSFPLIAVPLFIITGDLIVETGVADDLFDFAGALLGWIPGGMGLSAQGACGLFAAISGSNVADAAAIGRISATQLFNRGYPKDYSAGVVASAAVTGILIPPSISYIILGLTLRISISDLFLGTVIPGFLVIGLMMIVNIIITRKRDIDQKTDSFNGKKTVLTAWRAKYALFIPIIIIGGLYAGIFTPTEAGISAILFMIFIGAFTGELSLTEYREVLLRSALLDGMVVPLIIIFTIFSQSLSYWKIPQELAQALVAVGGGNMILVIAIVMLILMISGTILPTVPNILLLGPVLIPVGIELGFGIIHFSIFFLMVLALGHITPPVGLNLFVLSGIMDEPVEKVAYQALPFFFIAILAATVVLLLPETVTLLLD